MSFTIFQKEKTPFYAIKTGSLKSRKIDIFPNGFTHGFGPKMAIFPTFFFRQYRPGKCLLEYSKTKKTPFYALKTRSSKSRKNDLFPKGLPVVLVQTWPFFQLFLLGSIGKKNVFYDTTKRKNSYLGYKNKKFEKDEKLTFFIKG